MQSTALVLGIEEDDVVAFDSGVALNARYPTMSSLQSTTTKTLFEIDYVIPPNLALLYRLASGDSNNIHVDASAIPMLDSSRPLLHGLCTLGIVARFLLEWSNDNFNNSTLQHLEARFRKPVFIGDTISVKVWGFDDSKQDTASTCTRLAFNVSNATTGEVIVDKACAIMECRGAVVRSRL